MMAQPPLSPAPWVAALERLWRGLALMLAVVGAGALAGIFVLVPGLRVVFAILTVGLAGIAWSLQRPKPKPMSKVELSPANTPPRGLRPCPS